MKIIKAVNVSNTATLTRSTTATWFTSSKVMQVAAINEVRQNWNPETGAYEGVLVEPAATNLLLNTSFLSTQTRSITTAQWYTLSFWGTGTVTLSGAVASTIVGTHSYPYKRFVFTFQAASNSLTLTVSGTVQNAQLELGQVPTSYIPSAGTPGTRAADVITGTGLFYTTFVDSTPSYSAGTTYADGDIVQYGTRVYESQVGSNTGNTPSDPSSTFWLDIGPTNVFAMFDQQVSTPSVGDASVEVVAIKVPSNVDAVGLMNLNASFVHAVIGNGYSNFSGKTKSGELVSAILSGFTAGDIVTVWISRTSGYPSVGEFATGELFSLGQTQYGPGLGIIDYSKKITETDGTTTFAEGKFSKKLNCNIVVPKEDFNAVYAAIAGRRAKPTVWILSDYDDPDLQEANVYGFYRDFSISIAYPSHCLCDLEIEGLI